MHSFSDIKLERGFLANPFQIKTFSLNNEYKKRHVSFRQPIGNQPISHFYDFYSDMPEEITSDYYRPIFLFKSDEVFEISEFKEQYTERSQFISDYLIQGTDLLEQHSIAGTFDRLSDASTIMFPIGDICFEKHGNCRSIVALVHGYLFCLNSPKQYWGKKPEAIRHLDIKELLKNSNVIGCEKLR